MVSVQEFQVIGSSVTPDHDRRRDCHITYLSVLLSPDTDTLAVILPVRAMEKTFSYYRKNIARAADTNQPRFSGSPLRFRLNEQRVILNIAMGAGISVLTCLW